ncbi:hypothetical protein A1O7_06523 [Cladophialophora yegresii CBS 114405]|uniref:Uncharacterized protein n=1 Tax=Cladophialophora yegresii CBS 114405 TaxID=1182544 RepID=W9VTM0_9EURO|nr:uncharacterized protein A1O7_06523 [Cladophialophora yegresii CBS 114405]EXJ59092.1 hypothetical protein A1O7_06523 [Cladophialophora yegresii CBS 114405]
MERYALTLLMLLCSVLEEKSRLLTASLAPQTIHIHYTGIIDVTNEMRRILGRSVNAKTTDFGSSFIHVSFETGSIRYKSLEQALFVGSGRFIIDERGLTVEYRISKVCKGLGAAAEDPEAAPVEGDNAGGAQAETSRPSA